MESESMSRQGSISFPTFADSPVESQNTPTLAIFSTSDCCDVRDQNRMPPPRHAAAPNQSKVFTTSADLPMPERHSIASDDSSAASTADFYGVNVPISRPISASTLASSRPSSIASNASSSSHVQGQLIVCADLLSPSLASALGLVPSSAADGGFPRSNRNSIHGSADASGSNTNPVRRRVRAQSAHSGALSTRRPSMPIVPSMNHRISVASVSSFESLPEDEMVQGFLSPTNLHPNSRTNSYERISRSATATHSHTSNDGASATIIAKSRPGASSTPSLGNLLAASSSQGAIVLEHEAGSVLSSSASSSAHSTGPSTASQTSTLTAASQRPSAFLRRSATSPVPSADVSLLMAHRQRSAQELLETERSFVASLNLIDQEYYQPLMASLGKGKSKSPSSSSTASAATPILSRKSLGDIFSNFYDIFQLSKELLSQLEERLQASSAPGSSHTRTAGLAWNASTDCLGDILVTLAPFLKMYSLFVKNFSGALQRIEYEQKTNEAFSKFLKETDKRRSAKEKVADPPGSVRQAFGYGLGFQAHLLTIVQRIPRYKLLVDDLVKSTPETHPDFADLRRAAQMIEQVASYINENVRQHEMVLTMLGLQKNLQGLTEPLVAPGRSLIKRGTLMKTCRRNIQPREFFLFTDCLIYASPISGSIESASAAWMMLAQRGGLYSSTASEPPQSPMMASPSTSSSSPIETVLAPTNMAGPSGPRARMASLPEAYTPLAGAIFSLAGHQLQYRGKFGLRDCTVVSVEDNMHEGLRHCFEIHTPEKSFAVYAESAASKETWVNCIREARADHMSARRTLKAEEDGIEAKREKRRSLYKIDTSKFSNRRLSTQSLGAYLAGANLIGGNDSPAPGADEPAEARAPRAASQERQPLLRRSRVDSLPNLMRPPSFPSFPAAGAHLSLANLLASNPSAAAAAPLRVLEDYNAPVWVPDNRADKCCNCHEPFGMWRRKHHCRLCGQVVCWTCSQRSFLIPSYQEGEPDRPARACDRCFDSVFPSDAGEDTDAAQDANANPGSSEMAPTTSNSTVDSVSQSLGAYRMTPDIGTDAEGSNHGSPVTPPVGSGSPTASAEDDELSSTTTSLADISLTGRSALAGKDDNAKARPKSLRFEALPPSEIRIDTETRDGAVSPTTFASPVEISTPSEAHASAMSVQASRRGSGDGKPVRSASARTTPMRLQGQPDLPMRSNSLASQHLPSRSPRVMSPEARLNRASALEAHHLFSNYGRTSQIQAATSGSGTFRLVTPRLTTPETELPPGMTKSRIFNSSIMDAGYFSSTANTINEDAEDGSAAPGNGEINTSEPFKPWMIHAMSPTGQAPQLRPARKRPLSAAARLSHFYGPLLSSNPGPASTTPPIAESLTDQHKD